MKQTLTLILLLGFSSAAFSETCYHSIKEGTEKITWTGFKYTEKTAVGGTFDKVTFKQNANSKSMTELLESIEFSIDTESVNSGNPARDSTLKKTIFGYLKVPNVISGTFKAATPLDVIADLVMSSPTSVKLNLNTENNKVVATGSLDLKESGMETSFSAVHLACKGLHTGKDGISKTWSTVDLKIEADYEVKCSKGIIDSIKSWFS